MKFLRVGHDVVVRVRKLDNATEGFDPATGQHFVEERVDAERFKGLVRDVLEPWRQRREPVQPE